MLVIFHEIKKLTCVTTPIESLVNDGVLSDMLDWEGWLHVFIDVLFHKPESFWMVSTTETDLVRELAVQYFFERIAPKLSSFKSLTFQNLINE